MRPTVFLFADYQQLIRDIVEERGGAETAERYDKAVEQGGKLLRLARSLKAAGQPVHIVHVIVDQTAGHVRNADLYVTRPSSDGKSDPSTQRAMLKTMASRIDEKYGGEAKISAPVAPQGDERVMGRPTASAFFDTTLTADLRTLHVEQMVICGVATSGIVLASTQSAVERGLSVIVAEDGCMDFGDMHEAVMKYLAKRSKVLQIASLQSDADLLDAISQE